MNTHIKVLDKGYVRYIDHLGSDLSVVNAARASFKKESDWVYEHKESWDDERREHLSWNEPVGLQEKDKKLIKFLADRKELSPFRCCVVSFEVKAPLMIARQWFKYCVSSNHREEQFSWNEMSRRYVTDKLEFYVPDEWRSAPENKKAGSGGPVTDCNTTNGTTLTEQLGINLESNNAQGLGMYNWALKMGVCTEQSRLFLPAYGMYTTWRWTSSLQNILHLLQERLEDKAQKEWVGYANAVKTITEGLFPECVKAVIT